MVLPAGDDDVSLVETSHGVQSILSARVGDAGELQRLERRHSPTSRLRNDGDFEGWNLREEPGSPTGRRREASVGAICRSCGSFPRHLRSWEAGCCSTPAVPGDRRATVRKPTAPTRHGRVAHVASPVPRRAMIDDPAVVGGDLLSRHTALGDERGERWNQGGRGGGDQAQWAGARRRVGATVPVVTNGSNLGPPTLRRRGALGQRRHGRRHALGRRPRARCSERRSDRAHRGGRVAGLRRHRRLLGTRALDLRRQRHWDSPAPGHRPGSGFVLARGVHSLRQPALLHRRRRARPSLGRRFPRWADVSHRCQLDCDDVCAGRPLRRHGAL